MKKKILKTIKRKTDVDEKPIRVTNDTVAVHREEILKGARRYIYPLQHTKHRLVVVSISLFVVTLISFFAYCSVMLYKTKSTSDFIYKVTKVVPFPVARIGSDFVAYEDYLFEIRHYVHYYETQQELDFDTDAGKQQLAEFKKRALEKVINDRYIRNEARDRGLSVSDAELDEAIAVVREQNRLTGTDAELEAILRDYWDWSIEDFRRSLKDQLLSQKVISSLDTKSHDRANAALVQLKNGTDFAKLARSVSDDEATKAKGGEYPFLISKTNRDIPPKTVDALFALKPGKHSEVIDMGFGLEIVKNIEKKGDQIRAAHIVFNFKDINEYLNDAKEKTPTRSYLTL
jgi:hypothetical protein